MPVDAFAGAMGAAPAPPLSAATPPEQQQQAAAPAVGRAGSAPTPALTHPQDSQPPRPPPPTFPLGRKPLPRASAKQHASGLQHLSPRPDVVFDLAPTEVEVHEAQVLGRGAMGRVLRGRYKGMDVAVKMLLPQFQAEVASRSGGRHEDGDARGRARQRRDEQQDVSGMAATSPAHMDVAGSLEEPRSRSVIGVAGGGDSDMSIVPHPNSCSGEESGAVAAAPDSWAPVSTAGGEAGTAYDEAMQSIRALELELQIMGRLDHPHVLRLHGACLRPPGPFLLVQELCRCSLHTLLYNRGARRLALREVLSIEIMAGLEYLHSLNIIHRDLKPGNVLIDGARRAKIADFGLARCKYKSYLSTNKMDVGTLPYMAPECFSDHYGQVSTLSDIYSAAVMIGEMVNHTPPWKGCQEFNIVYQVTCTTALPHDVQALRCPPAMQQLLHSCYQRQAQARPNASQVLAALQDIQRGMQQE